MTKTGYKTERGKISRALLDMAPLERPDDPARYVTPPALADAVNVALALGMPLLVTGEPGTGKTRLAHSIAHDLGLGDPLVFNTKTTSTAGDLFYQYDALRRFQDVQLKTYRPDGDYIACQALGLAILLSNPNDDARPFLPSNLRNRPPSRSVVLIDEIDKAPRDLPNDILNEIERMSFEIKEAGENGLAFHADPQLRPILVLTSNSEKNLPDAFLRRCVFYHIPFPEDDELREIVEAHFKENPDYRTILGFLKAAVAQFRNIRSMDLKKPPATAEFLAWVRILAALGVDLENMTPREDIERSYAVLAKTRDDLVKLRG